MGIDTFKGDKLFLPSSEKGSLLNRNDLLPLVSTDFRIRNVLAVQESKLEIKTIAPTITKRCRYNLDPINHHLYVVKLGFTGVCIIVLISTHPRRF